MSIFSGAFKLNNATNNIMGMDGLRGLAAFMVFFVHFNSQISPMVSANWLTGWVKYSTELGRLGVDIFFVISGFVIYRGVFLAKNFSWGRFYRARVKRIFPVYWVALLMTLVIYTFLNDPRMQFYNFTSFIRDVFLLSPLFHIKPIVSVSWTLTFEIVFYIVAPVIAILGKKLNANVRLSIFFVVASLLYGYLYIYAGSERMLMFIVGIMVFEFHNEKRDIFPALSRKALLAIGTCMVAVYPYFIYTDSLIMSVYWILMVGVFLLSYVILNISYQDKILTSNPLRLSGNISYSYYLFHGMAIKGFFFASTFLLGDMKNIGLITYTSTLFSCFLFTVAFSVIMYLLIEYPMSTNRKVKT